jgi:hypothetical protein
MLYGREIWTFDALDYTILTMYSNGLMEGDIVDFGDIWDSLAQEVSCYLRNDSTSIMENVQITIHLDETNLRKDDLFLMTPSDRTGTKHLYLGDIIAGGSKEFIVHAFSASVQEWEMHKTYRVPLHVEYERRELW